MRGAFWFLVGIFIAFLGLIPHARAETIAATSSSTICSNDYPSVCGGSVGAAQAALASYLTSQNGVCQTYPTYVYWTWGAPNSHTSTSSALWVSRSGCGYNDDIGPWGANASGGGGYTCPDNTWTLNGTSCTRADCTAGTQKAGYSLASMPTTVNWGGCEATMVEAHNQCQVNGTAAVCGVWVETGQHMASGDGTAAAAIPAQNSTQCKPGEALQHINGTYFCGPATADAPSVTTETGKTVNADGTSAISVTTTTCNGTACTSSTTTTTKDASGTVTGTSTTDQTTGTKPSDVSTFCRDNPQSSICKVSTFAGTCAGFACDGDAVQCAIALEQHNTDCQLYGTSSADSTRAAQFAAGNDPDAASFPNPAASANREERALPGALDQSTFLGGGGLTDLAVGYHGNTITVPFSELNTPLTWFGNLLVAFCLLAGAMIVFRS